MGCVWGVLDNQQFRVVEISWFLPGQPVGRTPLCWLCAERRPAHCIPSGLQLHTHEGLPTGPVDAVAAALYIRGGLGSGGGGKPVIVVPLHVIGASNSYDDCVAHLMLAAACSLPAVVLACVGEGVIGSAVAAPC